MTKCTNCGAKLGCGCQKRVASDGHQCCTHCLTGYEAKIKKPKPPGNITTLILTKKQV